MLWIYAVIEWISRGPKWSIKLSIYYLKTHYRKWKVTFLLRGYENTLDTTTTHTHTHTHTQQAYTNKHSQKEAESESKFVRESETEPMRENKSCGAMMVSNRKRGRGEKEGTPSNRENGTQQLASKVTDETTPRTFPCQLGAARQEFLPHYKHQWMRLKDLAFQWSVPNQPWR